LAALAAALRDPHRIDRLVLVDGPLHPRAAGDDPFLTGLRHDYPATLDAFVEMCVPEVGCEHIKRWGRQIVGRASQENAIALLLAARDIDLRFHLAKVTQPTLIIHGERDALVPVQHAHELSAAIPHSRLLVLQGAGHVPTMTRPAEVAQAIADFLELSLPDMPPFGESHAQPLE
jgi:pimeloyl-ACP methyl ester carboxylesterase